MALSRRDRLLSVGMVRFAAFAIFFMGVDPEVQYSVDEILDNAYEHEDSIVFVRGAVASNSTDEDSRTFIINGPSKSILVDYSGAAVPDGYSEGITISVRGIMVVDDGTWRINAQEIQTGCPSKYESE